MAVEFLQSKTRQRPVRAADQKGLHLHLSGQLVIGLLFLVALIAFEIFNFDTTRFALESFLGTASFAGLTWATVLAIAFCAIDFAGLLRFFLPEAENDETPVEVWYLMGAWLLGATMNALMTWWAVSLTLLNHELGNEILSRAQILDVVPVFVAVLVWLTRILFIGAFTVAGGYLFDFDQLRTSGAAQKRSAAGQGQANRRVPVTLRPLRQPQGRRAPLPATLRPLKVLRKGGGEENKAPLKNRPQRLPRPARPNTRPHVTRIADQAQDSGGQHVAVQQTETQQEQKV